MAAQEITVDTGLLQTDIGTLESNLEQLKNQLKGVFKDMSELDTMWDGQANDAFKKQFELDHTAMKSMCDTIQSIIECYKNAKKEYNTCDGEVREIVNSIKI